MLRCVLGVLGVLWILGVWDTCLVFGWSLLGWVVDFDWWVWVWVLAGPCVLEVLSSFECGVALLGFGTLVLFGVGVCSGSWVSCVV